jgi:hypothetical protein
MKQKFLSQIDFNGIRNCNAFLVMPSVTNDNAKNVLFHSALPVLVSV